MRLKQYINEKIETKEFRDMIKDAIEDIYQQSKTVDKRNDLSKLIKNKLKPVFEDVILNVIGDKNSSIRVSIKQQDEGISARCTYDQMKNYFQLEMYIGKDLLSTSLYNNKFKRKRLLRSVQETAIHEITHLIQWYRSGGIKTEKPYYDTKKANIDKLEKYKKYLSLPEEIDAYATETAEYLIEEFGNDITISQIEEILQDKNKIVKLTSVNNVIDDYWDLFGQYQEENINARKVWRRFVKKLIEHLEEMK